MDDSRLDLGPLDTDVDLEQHAAQSKVAERRRRRATGLTRPSVATPAGPPAMTAGGPIFFYLVEQEVTD
jgi:hypothetical protein